LAEDIRRKENLVDCKKIVTQSMMRCKIEAFKYLSWKVLVYAVEVAGPGI
jgi:hypothetical protein